MNPRALSVAAGGIVLLAPSAAMANGMVRMTQSFEFTLTGGLIGCVIGVVIALARRAKIGRLLAFAMGAGLAAGLLAAALFVGAHLEFFSNNTGIVGALVIIALGTAVVGGLAAGLIGAGVRALRRTSSVKSAPAGPDERAP